MLASDKRECWNPVQISVSLTMTMTSNSIPFDKNYQMGGGKARIPLAYIDRVVVMVWSVGVVRGSCRRSARVV